MGLGAPARRDPQRVARAHLSAGVLGVPRIFKSLRTVHVGIHEDLGATWVIVEKRFAILWGQVVPRAEG